MEKIPAALAHRYKTLLNEKGIPDPNTFNSSNEKWKSALVTVANEIRVRHYSPKTLKAYTLWAHRFRAFLKNKDPDALSTDDVKLFLTHLAVDQHVSASSQNQAFNALLFFFRHALNREFGKVDGVVRAKRRPYIPVVLSRSEIDAIILNLQYPVSLVVKLLYGCGLRLFECLGLRTQNFNFEHKILTIHDGKGKRDRSVPIPRVLMPDLMAHLERVKKLHDRDLAAGYAGAFMFDAIEKNIKIAPGNLYGSGFSPPGLLHMFPVQRNTGGTISIQAASRKNSKQRSITPKYVKERLRIPFGTAMQVIYCKPTMTYERSRSYWVTRTLEPQ
jgi:integrase